MKNVKIEKIKISIPKRYSKLSEILTLLNPIAYIRITNIAKKIAPEHIIIAFFHPFLISLFWFFNNITFIDHDPQGHIGEKYFGLLSIQKCCKYLSNKVIVHSEQLIPKGLPTSQRKKYQVRSHGNLDFLLNKGNPEIQPKNHILFIGRFVKYKGIEYLIRAFAQIQDEFPDWKLVIKGSGDPYFEDELNKINEAQLIYENRFLPDDEFADTIRRCKVMVLPYIDGSQSGVVELALTFNKPVITTPIGGIIDQFKDTAKMEIVSPMDSYKLIKSLKNLITNLNNNNTI